MELLILVVEGLDVRMRDINTRYDQASSRGIDPTFFAQLLREFQRLVEDLEDLQEEARTWSGFSSEDLEVIGIAA